MYRKNVTFTVGAQRLIELMNKIRLYTKIDKPIDITETGDNDMRVISFSYQLMEKDATDNPSFEVNLVIEPRNCFLD